MQGISASWLGTSSWSLRGLESSTEIIDLVEKIEHECNARSIESKIALEPLGLGDTDNCHTRELPVGSRPTNGFNCTVRDKL